MMTDRRAIPRVPGHVLVMLGASTAAYALVLAGVAGLQSRTEAVVVAGHAPALDRIAELASGHAGLAARLEAARAAYGEAADAYVGVGGTLGSLDERLSSLAALVADIDGVSRSMPTTVSLPAIRRSVGSVRVPATHATTRASGG